MEMKGSPLLGSTSYSPTTSPAMGSATPPASLRCTDHSVLSYLFSHPLPFPLSRIFDWCFLSLYFEFIDRVVFLVSRFFGDEKLEKDAIVVISCKFGVMAE